MATIIRNIGRVPLQVGLVNTKTSKKTTVKISGRGYTPEPTGYTIDPNWMALYGKYIQLVDSSKLAPATQKVAKTKSSNVAARTAATKAAIEARNAVYANSNSSAASASSASSESTASTVSAAS